MRKKAEWYSENCLTDYNIAEIKKIILASSNERRQDSDFNLLTNFDQLLEEDGVMDMRAVIGEDWFLTYFVDFYEVGLTLWAAEQNANDKFAQSIEMYRTLKEILLRYNERTFYATLKHDTSYQFYKSFISRGFALELEKHAWIGDDLPEDVNLEILRRYGSRRFFIDEFMANESLSKKYGHLVAYDLSFKVTDKFVKTYKK